MLTGVTRPFHAPHALFTPSTGGTKHGPRPRGLNTTRSVHNTILRSWRHGRALDLLRACRGVRDRHAVASRAAGAMRWVHRAGTSNSSPVLQRAADGSG